MKSGKSYVVIKITIFVLSLVTFLRAITITVGKGGSGQYETVQAAINAARAGDIIKIVDESVYNEQVTIDSTKNGITLTSSNPLSIRKPTIKWHDKVNTSPKNCTEAKDVKLAGQFETNGALRILRARNVTIDGIAIDGGGIFAFCWPRVWDGDQPCQWPLMHGNAAITLVVAGNITIRNCDISNAFFGINVKDRNEGGISANPNPADIEPYNIVPLSGFALTGNHLIEKNRIHHNSWGIFFESVWDLGSTIRYNLFYNNHHPADKIQSILTLCSEGQQEGANHAGGAILLKDILYSPLAIYNNTFYHNMLIIAGLWQAGNQHLVFNNIYGPPIEYWGIAQQKYQNMSSALNNAFDVKFKNRMKHSVYAAQQQAPSEYYVGVMNGMQLQQTSGPVPPGTLIATPFGVDANIRWFETPFQSTDPSNPLFLTPKWDDPNVKKFIIDQGWPEGGIYDADGSIADLGAIPYSGIANEYLVVTPLAPVDISGTNALLQFNVEAVNGQISNIVIKSARFTKLPMQKGVWGPNATPLAAANPLTYTQSAVKIGSNTITVGNVPAMGQNDYYALIELTIEGVNSQGNTVSATAVFLPYRKLNYKFDVQIYALEDVAYKTPLKEVKVGQPYRLLVTPMESDGKPFSQKVQSVLFTLASPGGEIYNFSTNKKYEFPTEITGKGAFPNVMFVKVPSDGFEVIRVNGYWASTSDPKNKQPFSGYASIKILPGDPAKVVFQAPPSDAFGNPPQVIDPATQYLGELQVFDKFDNKVNQAVMVSIGSNKPSVGNIVGGAQTITTDMVGTGRFAVMASTTARKDEIFRLGASIPTASGVVTDSASMKVKVGEPKLRLWIFYGDTLQFDTINYSLSGKVGEKLRFTVIAAKSPLFNAKEPINDSVTIEASSSLMFFASANDSVPSTKFAIRNGRADIWVSSQAEIVNGRIISARTVTVSCIPGSRGQINFERSAIKEAFFYSSTGFGRVDSVVIIYSDTIAYPPDKVDLYWPSRSDENKKTVERNNPQQNKITLLSDSVTVVIKLADPFLPEITTGNMTHRLGTTYYTENGAVVSSDFRIHDGVGPLIDSAWVVERTEPGIDTLIVLFTEDILENLKGPSLQLIQYDVSVLAVAHAQRIGPKRYKLALAEGQRAPKPGDSLRIEPSGPIADVYSNKAHPQNRSVVIGVVATAAKIVYGYYKDTNADGVCDTAVVVFSKNVNLNGLWLSVDAGLGTTSEPIKIGGNVINNVAGVSLRGIIADSIVKTSGPMYVEADYEEFYGSPNARGMLYDSAAAVIIKAIYFQGRIGEPDTLEVTFSEGVIYTSVKEPFLFSSGDGTLQYSIFVLPTASTINGHTYRFAVDTIIGTPFPKKGDLIWINPQAAIRDSLGNIQSNPNNRKAVLDIKGFHSTIKVTLSENPIRPGINSTKIQVVPETKNIYAVSLTAKIKIFDAVGNLVLGETDMALEQDSRKPTFIWEGINSNGRYVGSGTYLGIINVTENDTKLNPIRLQIGVKR